MGGLDLRSHLPLLPSSPSLQPEQWKLLDHQLCSHQTWAQTELEAKASIPASSKATWVLLIGHACACVWHVFRGPVYIHVVCMMYEAVPEGYSDGPRLCLVEISLGED